MPNSFSSARRVSHEYSCGAWSWHLKFFMIFLSLIILAGTNRIQLSGIPDRTSLGQGVRAFSMVTQTSFLLYRLSLMTSLFTGCFSMALLLDVCADQFSIGSLFDELSLV